MKDFINELSNIKKVERKDLLEKDILIQKILLDLSKDNFFSKNFAFKGGTCLIKCYLGYYRFSEDIDFTWNDQSIYKHKSGKQIRKKISDIKDQTGTLLENISKKRNMNFNLDKNNKKYVEFGGGNKFVTFKIWFESEILKKSSFIKIQVNFVENIKFKIQKRSLNCIIDLEKDRELEVLYGADYSDYISNIHLYTYHIKEILCEKVRAILTRRGVKARDFVDIFLICKRYNLEIQDFKQEIIEKIRFMLNMYKKYNKNLAGKKRLLDLDDLFKWGAEKELLLKDINESQFMVFVKQLEEFLKEILKNFN